MILDLERVGVCCLLLGWGFFGTLFHLQNKLNLFTLKIVRVVGNKMLKICYLLKTNSVHTNKKKMNSS